MKSILNNPVVYLWRKMYKFSGNRKKHVTVATFMFILASIAEAIQPLIFALFLSFIQKNSISKENILYALFLLLIFILADIIFWALWGPARIKEQKSAFIIRKNYKEYLLRGTMNMPLNWHSDHHSGETIDKIEKGTGALFSFSEGSFQFIASFVQLIVAFSTLIYFSLYPAIILIFISFITFYIMFLYDKKLIPGYKLVNKLENKTAERVYDVISNITTVIILRIENLVFKSISKSIDTPYDQFRKNILNNEKKWFWASILGQVSVVILISVYLYMGMKSNEAILIGSIYILYTYSSKVKDTFFNFARLYSSSERWKANVYNSEEISKDFMNIPLVEERLLPKDWTSISISNLSFSYHNEENGDLHLDDINAQFNKGQKIAVIGESGGGKTTFLKILRGLYVPKNLNLRINEKDNKSDFNLISDSISLIPQDPEIFSTTIRENITLGVDYDDKEIEYFMKMASFDEVASRLPNGLESNIVEKGVNLSGGEKQRLALTRGLIASKDKEIILLDEPTSSVDFHNELKIYENIFKSFPSKTIISSIHRLHLLSLFDNIFFFRDGKIVAEGNLDQLKENSKDFKKLWAKYLKTQNS